MHFSRDLNRIEFLDGLRGLAILLVIFFHIYAWHRDLVPYGSVYSVDVFSYGWLGVQLFFLISGFVIFLTLDKCRTFSEFVTRRWLRLFPAMLVCSLLIWATASWFPERPYGAISITQLVPGLTFMAPNLLSLTGMHIQPIEVTFWSLFVEVQFYMIAGLSYFILGGRSSAILVIFSLFAAGVPLSWIQSYFGDSVFLRYPLFLLHGIKSNFYGWFAGGALLYFYYMERSTKNLLLGIAVVALASITEGGVGTLDVKIAAALVGLVFVGALLSPSIQRILSCRALLFLGFVSYPLYLVHENMMVATITKIKKWLLWAPEALVPVLPVALVILIAWVVAVYIEPPVRSALRKPAFALIGIRAKAT